MPVWKFPLIYAEIEGEITPAYFEIAGYTRYGTVYYADAECLLPEFALEGNSGAIAEIELPKFSVGGDISFATKAEVECTLKKLGLESLSGAIAQVELATFSIESDATLNPFANASVALPKILVEGIGLTGFSAEAEIQLRPLSIESEITETTASCKVELRKLSVESNALGGTIAQGAVAIPKFEIEASSFTEVFVNTECKLPFIQIAAKTSFKDRFSSNYILMFSRW